MALTQQQDQHRRRLMLPYRTNAHQLFWFHIFFSFLLWSSFPDVQRALDALLNHEGSEGPCRLHQIRGRNGAPEIGACIPLRTVDVVDPLTDVEAKFGVLWFVEDDVKLRFREPLVMECDNSRLDFPANECSWKSEPILPCQFRNECCAKNSSNAGTQVYNILCECSRKSRDVVSLASEWLPHVPRWPAYDGRGDLIGLFGRKLRLLLIPELPQDLDRAAPSPCVKDLLSRSRPDEHPKKLGKMMSSSEMQAQTSTQKQFCSSPKFLCLVVDYKCHPHSCSNVILHKHKVKYLLKWNENQNSPLKNVTSRRWTSHMHPQAPNSSCADRGSTRHDSDKQDVKIISSFPVDNSLFRLSAQQNLYGFSPVIYTKSLATKFPASSSFQLLSQKSPNMSLWNSVLQVPEKSLFATKLNNFCCSQVLLSPHVLQQHNPRKEDAPVDFRAAQASPSSKSCTARSTMVAAAQPFYTTERHIFTGFTTTQPPPPPPPPDFSIVTKEECGKSFCLFIIAYNRSFNFSRITLEYRDGDTANLTISLKLNITTGVIGTNFFGAKDPRRGFVYNLRGLSGRRRYYVCARGYPIRGVSHGVKTSCESFMTSDTDGETDMYNLTGIFLVLGISTIIMTVVLLCVGYEKLIDRKKGECIDLLLCRYKRKKTDKRPARGTISPEPLVVPRNNTRTSPQAYDNDTVSLSSTEDRRY